MKRVLATIATIAALIAMGALLWPADESPEAPTLATAAPTTTPEPAPAPKAEPAPEPPKQAVQLAFAKATTTSAEDTPALGIPRPEKWTEKNLAGTTWKAEGFDFVFAKDGTWHMAGRQASKWRIEGDRIKLFNDKGEVHYLDIEGNELTFNGKPIGYPVARE